MKHKIGFNRLDRMPAHRKALVRSMMTSLFRHERIITTKPKALEIRRYAEKEITRAKEDSVHNRRMVARKIQDEEILAKLFTDIAPRMKERAGGYTRILKIGARKNDAAEMVVLELVDFKLDSDKSKVKDAKKADKKAEKKAKKDAEPEKEDKKASSKAKA